jgi:hemoglobin
MRTVFEAAGGVDGLRRLADAWHHRVMTDDVVSHAFSHGFHPQHVERLAAYWAEALCGPSTYSGCYGDETTVVRMHSGNGEHEEMNRRAIACFDQALVDAGLADDFAQRQVLHDYFAWATTTAMLRYHQCADDVPRGLNIPRWSWDGLEVHDATPDPHLHLTCNKSLVLIYFFSINWILLDQPHQSPPQPPGFGTKAWPAIVSSFPNAGNFGAHTRSCNDL